MKKLFLPLMVSFLSIATVSGAICSNNNDEKKQNKTNETPKYETQKSIYHPQTIYIKNDLKDVTNYKIFGEFNMNIDLGENTLNKKTALEIKKYNLFPKDLSVGINYNESVKTFKESDIYKKTLETIKKSFETATVDVSLIGIISEYSEEQKSANNNKKKKNKNNNPPKIKNSSTYSLENYEGEKIL